jgi:phosphatidylinositol alpha-1,6-mannosyltransferase
MKHLLLVPELSSIGGMQLLHRLLIQAMDRFLDEYGGQLLVYSLNDNAGTIPHSSLKGLKVTNIKSFGRDRRHFCLHALSAFPGTQHVFYGLLGFTPLALFQTMIAPYSRRHLLIHGVEAWDNRGHIYALSARHMTGVISISQHTLNRYRQAYKIRISQPGFVLPCCLGSDYQPSESTPLRRDGAFRLLSAARLVAEEQYKGIDTVLRALPKLLEAFPELVYVVIGDGSDRRRLENLAKQLDVERNVQFRGFVTKYELEREYRDCDLYVMPSAGEGFGIVFIEAMAFGKPVVAARAGATPEVIEHGITGMLVQYGDVAELGDVLNLLLVNTELRREMGLRGARCAMERYTFEAFCQRTAKLMYHLIQG